MGNKASVDETDSMTRVYCVSDLHSDEEDNMELLEKLVAKTPKHPDINVLIVAGDISGDCKVIEETLLLLLQVFPTIFYCPGNNELRMHKKEKGFDSIEKFEKVMKICEKIGVHVTAKKINGVWIVPLFSWYTPTFSDDWDGDFSYQRGSVILCSFVFSFVFLLFSFLFPFLPTLPLFLLSFFVLTSTLFICPVILVFL
eukprot:TRINITY_DN5709_c0_g1_i2.p1 TRINITY_DN5709_c0_g1~~TRINITY_DN5709_c0_g1_i2.p1  ORF type:complete len:199 (-),score=44.70 TRINITY_DN5709_c0_g1_i2:9-605(-)